MAESLYAELVREEIEVLFDDREESPGAKFKDADLIGIPVRIIIGSRALRAGLVEIRWRKTEEQWKLPRGQVVGRVRELLGQKAED